MKTVFWTALLTLVVGACGSDPVAPPPPPPSRVYTLASLLYEDVLPGSYAAEIVSYTGGPASISFAEATGKLVVASPLIGVMKIVYPDSSSISQTISILAVGTTQFSFQQDSAGVLTFTSESKLWPFPNGAMLTDSTYSFDDTACYNEGCTDYIRLAFVWMRQS